MIEVTTSDEVSESDSVSLDVVGESHYQEALWSIVGTAEPDADGRIRVRCRADLVAEPDNPYDPNAVQVIVKKQVVGYLRRVDAAVVQPKLPQPNPAWGHIVGRRGASLGVFLYCLQSLLE